MKKIYTNIQITIQTFETADIVRTCPNKDDYEGEIDWVEGYVNGSLQN